MDVKSKYWGGAGGTQNSLSVTSKGMRRNWRPENRGAPPVVKEMGQDIPRRGHARGSSLRGCQHSWCFPWLAGAPPCYPCPSCLCTPQA